MLLAEFDLPTTLTNFGIAGLCVWCFSKIMEKQMDVFKEQMAVERVRADDSLASSIEHAEAALSKERQRAALALAEERERANERREDDRKIWTGGVRAITARQAALESTVRQYLDQSKANNGHLDE